MSGTTNRGESPPAHEKKLGIWELAYLFCKAVTVSEHHLEGAWKSFEGKLNVNNLNTDKFVSNFRLALQRRFYDNCVTLEVGERAVDFRNPEIDQAIASLLGHITESAMTEEGSESKYLGVLRTRLANCTDTLSKYAVSLKQLATFVLQEDGEFSENSAGAGQEFDLDAMLEILSWIDRNRPEFGKVRYQQGEIAPFKEALLDAAERIQNVSNMLGNSVTISNLERQLQPSAATMEQRGGILSTVFGRFALLLLGSGGAVLTFASAAPGLMKAIGISPEGPYLLWGVVAPFASAFVLWLLGLCFPNDVVARIRNICRNAIAKELNPSAISMDETSALAGVKRFFDRFAPSAVCSVALGLFVYWLLQDQFAWTGAQLLYASLAIFLVLLWLLIRFERSRIPKKEVTFRLFDELNTSTNDRLRNAQSNQQTADSPLLKQYITFAADVEESFKNGRWLQTHRNWFAGAAILILTGIIAYLLNVLFPKQDELTDKMIQVMTETVGREQCVLAAGKFVKRDGEFITLEPESSTVIEGSTVTENSTVIVPLSKISKILTTLGTNLVKLPPCETQSGTFKSAAPATSPSVDVYNFDFGQAAGQLSGNSLAVAQTTAINSESTTKNSFNLLINSVPAEIVHMENKAAQNLILPFFGDPPVQGFASGSNANDMYHAAYCFQRNGDKGCENVSFATPDPAGTSSTKELDQALKSFAQRLRAKMRSCATAANVEKVTIDVRGYASLQGFEPPKDMVNLPPDYSDNMNFWLAEGRRVRVLNALMDAQASGASEIIPVEWIQHPRLDEVAAAQEATGGAGFEVKYPLRFAKYKDMKDDQDQWSAEMQGDDPTKKRNQKTLMEAIARSAMISITMPDGKKCPLREQ